MRHGLSILTSLTPVVVALGFGVVATRAAAQARLAGQDRLTRELTAGHAVLLDLAFATRSARLDPASRPRVARLARAINATSGTYLIGAYVDDSGDAEGDQALSGKRAIEVKALLVLEGVPPERVLAAGYGATSPRATVGDGASRRSGARIEVLRVQ